MTSELQRAIQILQDRGVVAYPTDTVYGLGVEAFNKRAVDRLYRIKQRPTHQPLPLLVAETADLQQVAKMTELARPLIKRFLPGALTLVMKRAVEVPRWLAGEDDKIAVRIPNHPLTLSLIQGVGKPIVGTSANLSGLPSPVTAKEVQRQIGNEVDFILDGGRCPGGVESTVVDVTAHSPVVLREGAISRNEVEEAIAAKIWR